MVIDVVESSLILNFFSYGASVSGLLLGVLGSSMYVRLRKASNLKNTEQKQF